ncbi:Nuclear protein DGCR14 [Penicillium hispanicum]|uniref:Nuclear protein DGCR14 n=1 Tax=Penicillium hispanicum TaxID=1080232 RepID=UPI002540C2D9|nr:Nuclear protein DGCR14 [Penicillium hispanicum]KAJ5584059.1 Nuclear protein DGCR14 [Penicillium hispanicum]
MECTWAFHQRLGHLTIIVIGAEKLRLAVAFILHINATMASPSSRSQALAKRPDNQLMPPPPPPNRIKRPATVLDEDVYTSALSHIIARDFFPGLLETQAKQEYLDALESKDKEWITSSKSKLADVMRTPTPGSNARRRRDTASVAGTPQHLPGRADETPRGWGGETPMSVTSTSTVHTERKDQDIPDVSNMGLLAFQAKYTSEDNESFNKVLDKQNAKRREKYSWLWNRNKLPSAKQIAHHQQEVKRITAQGGNPNTSVVKRDTQPIKTDLDARPAQASFRKSSPDNSLMFMPPSIEDTHETLQQKAEAASRAGPKRTLYQNTRLLDADAAAAADAANKVPPSPSISAIQDAIAGRPRLSESEAGSVVPGGETPRVNGYAFVDEDEPEPEPALGSSLEADWRLLGSSDATPNPFQIRESRKREALHHRMVDRVARNKRAEKTARITKTPITATPRFASSPRLDFGLHSTPTPNSGSHGKMLTPAAQKLLSQVGGSTPRSSSGPGAGAKSGLGNLWTPTPRRK